ncbi:hypothetical protein BGX28_000669, partial [Mortierella sp. GBA30]
MSIHTSHSHINPKTLDSLLQNTLHIHNTYVHNTHTDSSSPALSPSMPHPPITHAALPAAESDHGYSSAFESDSIDLTVKQAPRDNRRGVYASLDLNLNSSLSSSSCSSDAADDYDRLDETDTPLTSSTSASPTMRPSSQHLSPPVIPPRPTLPMKSSTLFLSAPASPTSTISPTSPLKVAFSSPFYHRYDPAAVTTTFSSFYDQLSPHSKLQFEQPQEEQKQQQFDPEVKYNDEANTEQPFLPFRNGSQSQPSTPDCLISGSQQSSNLQQQQQQQQQQSQQHRPQAPTPIRTSMGEVSSDINIHSYNTCMAQHLDLSDHNGQLVQQMLNSHQQQQQQQQQQTATDSKLDVIPIHVRYVPKDLWVQVDVPRDMPVHRARDLILSKCRLTYMSPQTSSINSSEETLDSPISPVSTISSGDLPLPIDPDQTLVHGSSAYELLTEKQDHQKHGVRSNDQNLPTGATLAGGFGDGVSIISRRRRSSRMTTCDDESINDQESIDDEEAEMRAEELMADDMFPQSPPSRASCGNSSLTESMLLSLQSIPFVSSRLRQESQSSFVTNVSEFNGGDLQRQNKRQIAYSKLHRDDGYGSGTGSGGDRSSKDSGSSSIHSRLSHIPGWSHCRSRQNSNNTGKKLADKILDHGNVMTDTCTGNREDAVKSDMQRVGSTAWKASFGLFWVAAGHWLDDSRLVSSYALQSHCLLELQLRNNYIQLPPPGTSLSYYDHYAEGALYKLSKKGHSNKITGHNAKDSAGGWKERWVVLQGTTLLIYHKRKDKAKKSIELTVPLTAVSTVLPLSPRHGFRRASSSAMAMSTSMITLRISPEPNATQLCFRATSES